MSKFKGGRPPRHSKVGGPDPRDLSVGDAPVCGIQTMFAQTFFIAPPVILRDLLNQGSNQGSSKFQ